MKVINLIPTLTLTSLIILTLPITMTLLQNNKTNCFLYITKMAVTCAFAISLIPTLLFLQSNQEAYISNWHWMTIQTLKLSLSFKLDFFSLTFMPIALFITWSIMEFSLWYMHSDPHINRFFKYLLLFLITMLILVSANNLLQLFMGWEGVGIMSFLLISWWHGRTDANTAALQAMLYNRIGDMGFIMMMAWFIIHLNSWEFQQIFLTNPKNTTLPLLGLLLASAGKSAQFGLHPWLPSAMEGPTPVSALLHSSTMVMAGVFTLIRFYPLMENNLTIQTSTLCLGAITTLFTAICALTQNDIKKIIALSTSSQLGLMMVTIGINQPHLAFTHMCTHAFFKAMLFLSSGSIIHNLDNEQDIRKMGGLYKTMPITSTAIIIGSLALTGMPFLTGFYSKDPIIETANMSYINTWALLITLIAVSMTASYSTRIIFFALLGQPRYPTLIQVNENNPYLINPIKRLILGSIFMGFFISMNTIPHTTPQMTMPPHLKFMALAVTLLGFTVATELNNMTHNLTFKQPSRMHTFSTTLGYYPTTTHRILPYLSLTMSQNLATTIMDSIWLEKMIPKNLTTMQKTAASLVSNQKGLMKLYFLSFLLSITLGLLITL
uniref:NADH-ubiquinone oxidoreductase chain 5 n=4 Tax=Elephantidae TaxID=9780 RepID=NU5M_ELEMA|nr:RecName: Full=NADH-ubiquinone oxidoreductase chain 5; AltName: Full=NADH dehydrogenase subunit 5 [Elephas maximus]AAX34973.1 NADH dehydrogenase subunit 5 [Elephas maximus]AAX34977.1 NADH dehydrogenase subunit 5 [Elephas maximus]AAX34981.1 NADH dehydrogenase subunit 5 [Elephas maximus]AAX34985.1 NADH dehydrogenase subunit 5 [Elephas maximus]AAX34989.1 NADH dehydrogenase subunit 5 [Elephas maximus]